MNEENRRRNRPKEEKERFLQYYIDKYDSGALSRLDYVKKFSLNFYQSLWKPYELNENQKKMFSHTNELLTVLGL